MLLMIRWFSVWWTKRMNVFCWHINCCKSFGRHWWIIRLDKDFVWIQTHYLNGERIIVVRWNRENLTISIKNEINQLNWIGVKRSGVKLRIDLVGMKNKLPNLSAIAWTRVTLCVNIFTDKESFYFIILAATWRQLNYLAGACCFCPFSLSQSVMLVLLFSCCTALLRTIAEQKATETFLCFFNDSSLDILI